MILAYLLLLTGLTISAVAIYYSVIGLTAIFSAAMMPIIIMGSALEVGKLVCASWLKANWERAPALMKVYMTTAVIVLMLITSMGIFGFLSKAHSDQTLVSGNVTSKIAIYDEKIKTERENIEVSRKALKQMDAAVDETIARSKTDQGAANANAMRQRQAKERTQIQADITKSQTAIAALNQQRAPVAAEIRKVEAEVGPLKYIAAFIYGETSEGILERAVTWVIITIIVVFDPLAIIMLLAAQMTFGWKRDEKTYTEDILSMPFMDKSTEAIKKDPDPVTRTEPIMAVPAVQPVVEPMPAYKPDDAPLTADQVVQIQTVAELTIPGATESELDKWNKMVEEAEKEADKIVEEKSLQERLATGESYVDGEGKEITLEATDSESKKKIYMTKDSTGQMQVKNRM